MKWTALAAVALCALIAPPALAADPVPAAAIKPAWTFTEVMVPMRDGTKLQTVIMAPADQSGPLPILLRRTPYGVPDKAWDKVPATVSDLAADGYIFVVQNIRGRFKSEGTFSLSEDVTVIPGQGTIETRDAYDTIDWLVRNVPNNSGKVGIMGVSYDGMTAGVTLLGPHPALKAVSEQAAPVDQWMNDDMHRFGALRLSYAFEYAVLEEADKTANTHFAFDRHDTYDWYLHAGPLATLDRDHLKGKIRFWNEAMAHPDYDAFWKSQAWVNAIKGSTVPNLNVAGFWDQEDPWGPWQIREHAAAHDPDRTNLMVAGPWFHGGWRGSVSKIGAVPLGQDTSAAYRKTIEAPYFAYWLHGKGTRPAWAATLFQTGSNTWKTYPAWPVPAAHAVSLYFHADGRLDFTAPASGEKGLHRDYVSDPANPVPYRQRPVSPTYPGGDWRLWESQDQRFVDHRPDVLSFVSAPLDHDLTVTGKVAAEIYAATTGTDADVVVKLIDVQPDDAAKPAWDPEAGPAPGQFGQSPDGYELPIAMEVRRGRYLDSFEHPHALVPGKPRLWSVPMRERDHVFLKGHRIMVQIQSSWFPLIDRNPQTFVASIPAARATDFRKSRQSIYAAPGLASRIVLPVVE